MNYDFVISCGSTADVPYEYMQKRDIPVIFYTYSVDGAEYSDNMGRDDNEQKRFYDFLNEGKQPLTSQINEQTYFEFFEKQISRGNVLHIAFSSGLSGSVNNAFRAAERINRQYPNRKVVVIDSMCGCVGYGLLVLSAADLRDEGKPFDEVCDWVTANRFRVHHQFYSTDLSVFRRSGRLSGPAAMAATVLGICPVMHLNKDGRIVAYKKARGKKNAQLETVREIQKHIDLHFSDIPSLWIAHSDCSEQAAEMAGLLVQQIPELDGHIKITDIGAIIASHCGRGTVALFFFGDERKE